MSSHSCQLAVKTPKVEFESLRIFFSSMKLFLTYTFNIEVPIPSVHARSLCLYYFEKEKNVSYLWVSLEVITEREISGREYMPA